MLIECQKQKQKTTSGDIGRKKRIQKNLSETGNWQNVKGTNQ